jgi:hypothetical protein
MTSSSAQDGRPLAAFVGHEREFCDLSGILNDAVHGHGRHVSDLRRTRVGKRAQQSRSRVKARLGHEPALGAIFFEPVSS